MRSLLGHFKEPAGVLYHGGAIAYVVLGYMTGVAGLFAASGLVNAAAVLLLAHAMVIAAYMIHECGHNTVFRTNPANARLGRFMSWICGAAYGTYEDMRHKHFRHHVDNADVVWFDYEEWFRRHPVVLKVVQVLEWLYIPAHEVVMHAAMVLTSFVIPQRRDQRARNALVILVRGSLYLSALILWPKAALLYTVAYLIMLVVLRFMDSLQHDYGAQFNLFTDDPSPHKGDRDWEQLHTFSNPLSLRHEKVNWLVLNFGFHNAHHTRPTLPWFRLPALHRELFGDDPQRVVPFASQCRIYHRGRVDRVYKWAAAGESGTYPQGEAFLLAAQRAEIPGGNAASFLTSF